MRVLLAEDDPLIASGIHAGLDALGLAVEHCRNAAQARQMLEQDEFDAMVLDLGLPDQDGLDLLTQVRARGDDLPVLILSARDSVLERVRGLQSGADDYLSKPFDLRELVARLQALARRRAGRTSPAITHGALRFDPLARSLHLHDRPVDLARRELALLETLLTHPGRIFSAEQLKDRIYAYGEEVASNALNVHLHHLRRKLGRDVIETVRGLGYRLGSPPR